MRKLYILKITVALKNFNYTRTTYCVREKLQHINNGQKKMIALKNDEN